MLLQLIISICIFSFSAFSDYTLNLKHVHADSEGDRVVVSKDLKAIKDKLVTLPFKKFSLVDNLNIPISLGSQVVLSLSNGDSVEFVLEKAKKKKFSARINWQDSKNTELLNSKFRSKFNRPFLTGADIEKGGKILVLVVSQN